MSSRLYLASTSPYRAEHLRRLQIPFAIEAPDTDETAHAGERPEARALRLARVKAAAVADRHSGSWVIGADQVAVCRGRVLGKPGGVDRCREQLAASSGRSVEFHTAVVLLRAEADFAAEHIDRTVVRFRTLTPEEISRYVEIDRPFDCAGGFRSEGLGITLFQSIETSDPTALVGLPLIWVAGALRAAGFDSLAPAQP